MKFEQITLENGLQIVAEIHPAAHSAAVGVFVEAGSRDETDAVSGVSHFLEHMAFKGTSSRTADDVNRQLDDLGSQSNARTGEEIDRFPDQNREVWDIGFLDNGKLMVTVGTLSGGPDDAHIKVWEYATKRLVRAPVPNGTFTGARCQAISSDGKYLAVASSTGPVKVFDALSWQEVLSVPDLTGCDFRVAFTPDGKNVILANGEGAVITVRLPTPPPDAQLSKK